ncbi:MAG: hypothetical protein IPN93_17700 [Bacteroidetes bacterium]|nr:hypothetical protein [Bacteroidota bacterium]
MSKSDCNFKPSAPSGVIFKWYDAATNGNLLFTGSSFTALFKFPETYYVPKVRQQMIVKSLRTSVTVFLFQIPILQQSFVQYLQWTSSYNT